MSSSAEAGGVTHEPGSAVQELDRLLLSAWGPTLGLLGVAWIVTLLLQASTVESLVATWLNSSSFTHCFLILPISIWLAWGVRHRLLGLLPEPSPVTGLLAVTTLACASVVGTYASAQVLEEYALAATLIALAVAILGRRAAWRLGFPLGYLLLAVPVGTSLLQPMMDFTTAFAVAGLEASGVPVYVQGNLIETPSGSWRVVEACAGVRYVTASVTLGAVYAWLTYRSALRRALFMLASVVVPILANGIRAYTIIMAAHLSGMEAADGIDHVTYGWVLFGIVMLVLFTAGGVWREDVREPVHPAPPPTAGERPRTRGVALAALLLAIVALGTLPARWLEATPSGDSLASTSLPSLPGDFHRWKRTAEAPLWVPADQTADEAETAAWTDGSRVVWTRLACHADARTGAEPISSANALVSPNEMDWVTPSSGGQHRGQGTPSHVNFIVVKRGTLAYLVWQWWWTPGGQTSSRLQVKVQEFLAHARGRPAPACTVVLWTGHPATHADAGPGVLDSFATDLAHHLAPTGTTEH